MIIFDTETTGIPDNSAMPLHKQPEIIEFAAVKLDDKTLIQTDELSFFCKPSLVAALPPIITKITGITDKMLENELKFLDHHTEVSDFFFGEKTSVAHQHVFDWTMLTNELRRIGKEFQFPYTTNHVCTIEKSYHLKNCRLKQGDLYRIATGGEMKNAHRAIDDVKNLAVIVRWMRKKKML